MKGKKQEERNKTTKQTYELLANGTTYSFSPKPYRLCVAFFTKYLPTCEFHCWTLDKRNDDTFCRQMTDWLCVKKKNIFVRFSFCFFFFSGLGLATFTSSSACFFLSLFYQIVFGVVSFYTVGALASIWLICFRYGRATFVKRLCS